MTTQAMILAAGTGSRLLGETADKPKALVDLHGKTLLQHTIEKLRHEGVTDIVVNTHHFPEKIKAFISENDFGVKIIISDESKQLLDTGGALKKAAGLFATDKPVIIHNVDIISSISLKKLAEFHRRSGALATVAVRRRQTQRYLRFDTRDNRLTGWVNKKTGEEKVSISNRFNHSTEMAFSGIHIVSPEIFRLMPKDEETFSVIDLYLDLAKTHLINGYFDESDVWIDLGKPDALAQARQSNPFTNP